METKKGNYAAIAVCLLALLFTCSAEDGDRSDDARLFAAIRTLTQLSFVSTTTTVPYTCHLSLNTQACRKRRRFRKALDLPKERSDKIPYRSDLDIVGSFADNHAIADTDDNEGSRDPKLALTLWQSFTSTYTIAVTTTNLLSTFSVSFFCSIVGGNFPPAC
ncbi:uncharacterized protein LOC108664856 [Hyalella azteca]|uniref:Uncharacterized protein LOC108664856 n=1 Tax=Hyalella azteca TaxID=294128 RepID=A0A8B7MZN3_HYAAZ|nr:uncharacterized protein LOC108664856 [Hyalella azteca]